MWRTTSRTHNSFCSRKTLFSFKYTYITTDQFAQKWENVYPWPYKRMPGVLFTILHGISWQQYRRLVSYMKDWDQIFVPLGFYFTFNSARLYRVSCIKGAEISGWKRVGDITKCLWSHLSSNRPNGSLDMKITSDLMCFLRQQIFKLFILNYSSYLYIQWKMWSVADTRVLEKLERRITRSYVWG